MATTTNSIKGRQTWAKPRDNTPWDVQDERFLRRAARRKLSARQAARELGRSTGSVKYKAMVLGVRFRYVQQPKGVQQRPTVRRRHRKARLARGLSA